MPRELTDRLLAAADFGEYVFVDDSGAETSATENFIEISKPLFFKDPTDEDADSICESMEIKINLKEKSVTVEHNYSLNAGELERITSDYYFQK